MKSFRVGILFAFIAVAGMAVVSRPHWLSDNTFLDTFISHEIIAVLVVILTITFASVANIHLSLNRLAEASPRRKQQIGEIRKEINSEAWVIFWSFIVCVIALVTKGAADGNPYVVAASHAVGAVVLLLNLLVLHTIYRAIFALVAAESAVKRSNANGEGGDQDYSSESPPAG